MCRYSARAGTSKNGSPSSSFADRRGLIMSATRWAITSTSSWSKIVFIVSFRTWFAFRKSDSSETTIDLCDQFVQIPWRGQIPRKTDHIGTTYRIISMLAAVFLVILFHVLLISTKFCRPSCAVRDRRHKKSSSTGKAEGRRDRDRGISREVHCKAEIDSLPFLHGTGQKVSSEISTNGFIWTDNPGTIRTGRTPDPRLPAKPE